MDENDFLFLADVFNSPIVRDGTLSKVLTHVGNGEPISELDDETLKDVRFLLSVIANLSPDTTDNIDHDAEEFAVATRVFAVVFERLGVLLGEDVTE